MIYAPRSFAMGRFCFALKIYKRVRHSSTAFCYQNRLSFVQPLSLASARQPFPFRHLRATSPGRGSLSDQGSPWQRDFVFDETDLRLLENVTECQSLPY